MNTLLFPFLASSFEGNFSYSALFSSTSLITSHELGDKTFLIASLMALQKSRWTVLLGSMTAMALMNCISSKDIGRCSLNYFSLFLLIFITVYFQSFLDLKCNVFPPGYCVASQWPSFSCLALRCSGTARRRVPRRKRWKITCVRKSWSPKKR